MGGHAAKRSDRQGAHARPEPRAPEPPATGGPEPELARIRTEHRLEPVVLGTLAVTAALLSWATQLPHSRWPAALLVLCLGIAPVRWREERLRLARAVLACTAGTVAALVDPALAPLTLLCAVSVTACYPFLLPPEHVRPARIAALTSLVLPLISDTGTQWSLTDVFDEGRVGCTFALLGGVAVVLTVGALTGAAGRDLLAGTEAAARRSREAHRAGRELDRLAGTDVVTGLADRDSLLRATGTALGRTGDAGGRVGLLVLEIDRFDTLTTGFGAALGEEVLRTVARRIRASRPAENVVARTSGARFAVLVEGVGPEGCTGVARRLRSLLEEPVRACGRDLSVTCAIGVALSGRGLDGADDLLGGAEEALHAARIAGRSRCATYDQAMRAHTLTRASMELELREALSRHDVGVVFQPIAPITPLGAGAGGPAVEALARWTRYDGTTVPPEQFVPLAEDLGLGGTLGFQVLERALDALAGWRAAGRAVGRVGVNAGRSQLEDPEFARTVAARLAARSLPPACLSVHVDQDALAGAAHSGVEDEVIRTLDMLRSLGVEVVLDAVGRAGVALADLRHLPIDLVTLDRSVTADLGRHDAVPRALTTMCHDLGLRVVAEGVESPAQLEAARLIGIDAVQGVLVGAPVPAEELTADGQRFPAGTPVHSARPSSA